MAITKRQKATAIVAGATAAALLLGGTFAWASISQQARNEAAGIVNVGGRLHNDFNGTNKDVYVENFTDPLNGGQPIYARVKLTEYMEIGQDAGGFGQDTNNDGRVTAVPVISGTDINDKDNWPVHIPEGSCAACTTEGTCKLHDHWSWTMGGDNGTAGSTIFMPTFNKDKDSLAADINGTYHGTDNTDKVYYDDYVLYTADNTAEGVGVGVAEAAKEAYDGSIYSVIGTEYYDDDTDTADNGGARQVENVTHTAKQTAEGTVILMQDWNGNPGNYWVYDEDGWAYWANPIMPGEATGLLLDGIAMEKNPGEKCYYAINVVGQFATVNDWEEFYTDADTKKYDVSPDAEAVLKAAAGNVATVTVTNLSGETLLTPGENYEFSANVAVNGVQVLAANDFEWSVLNADKNVSKYSAITDGVLTVGANETSKNLIVVAKAKDAAYLGALGMSAVAVKGAEKLPVAEDITKYTLNSVFMNPLSDTLNLIPGSSVEVQACGVFTDENGATVEMALPANYATFEVRDLSTDNAEVAYNEAESVYTVSIPEGTVLTPDEGLADSILLSLIQNGGQEYHLAVMASNESLPSSFAIGYAAQSSYNYHYDEACRFEIMGDYTYSDLSVETNCVGEVEISSTDETSFEVINKMLGGAGPYTVNIDVRLAAESSDLFLRTYMGIVPRDLE